ncbi:MAG: hypothetical protein R8J85_03970 [Mariprofundales bacterium]
MNIIFTIDALMDSGKQAWRCTDNSAWRTASFAEHLQANDAMLTETSSIQERLGLRMRQDPQLGLVPCGKSGVFDFLQRGIFTHAIVHRTSSAPLPDQAQMCSTIAAMEPGYAQLLYLDLGGVFRSRPATDLIHNLAIAVRGEVASSAPFIGAEAAQNSDYTNGLWQQFAAGWLQHLNSRRINCFVPNLEQCLPVEESLLKAEQWIPERRP